MISMLCTVIALCTTTPPRGLSATTKRSAVHLSSSADLDAAFLNGDAAETVFDLSFRAN